MALRSLGLPLDVIGDVLDKGFDLQAALSSQLENLEEQLKLQRQLRKRLTRLLDALDHKRSISPENLLEVLEVMKIIEEHYSSTQLAELERRRRELGDDALEQAQREWTDLIADVQSELTQNPDPTTERAKDLARRWDSLVDRFTGGDPAMRQSLEDMYSKLGPEKASQGAVSVEVFEFVQNARKAIG
jgi:hypothetical protein